MCATLALCLCGHNGIGHACMCEHVRNVCVSAIVVHELLDMMVLLPFDMTARDVSEC